MAQQNINIGSSANKGDGDPIRTAFTKVNTNFTELYNRVVVAEGQLGIDNAGGATIQQSIIGSVFADDSTVLVDAVNGNIPGYVKLSVLQSTVAASTDFADLKVRIAALT